MMKGNECMRKTTNSMILSLLLILLVGLASPRTQAQTNTGTILGTITDETGAVIPDAQVVAKNLGTGIERTVKAGASGEFSMPNLQIGHYSVTASHEGFAPASVQDTELQVAERTMLNIVLHLGSAS